MECDCCKLKRCKLYCDSCMRASLVAHSSATAHVQSQLTRSQARCRQILTNATTTAAPSTSSIPHRPPHDSPTVAAVAVAGADNHHGTLPSYAFKPLLASIQLRAEVETLSRKKKMTAGAVEETRRLIEIKRAGLIDRKIQMEDRRRKLSEAAEIVGYGHFSSFREELSAKPDLEDPFDNSLPSIPPPVSSDASTSSPSQPLMRRRRMKVYQDVLETTRSDGGAMNARLVNARRVLVNEVVGVFGLRAKKRRAASTAERLSAGGGGSRDETSNGERGSGIVFKWEIAGLSFPDPPGFVSYPSIHLNAVLGHTVHLLILVAWYLDVLLPFQPSWQGSPIPSGGHGHLQYHHIGFPNIFETSSSSHSFSSQTPTTADGSLRPTQGTAAYGASMPTSTMSTNPPPTVRPSHDSKRFVGKIYLSANETAPFVRLSNSLGYMTSDDVSNDPGDQGRGDETKHSGRDSGSRPPQTDRHIVADDLVRDFPVVNNVNLYVSTSRQKWKKKRRVGKEDLSQSVLVERKNDGQVETLTSVRALTGNGLHQTPKDKYTEKEEHLVLSFAMVCFDLVYLLKTQGLAGGGERQGEGDARFYSEAGVNRKDWARPLSMLTTLKNLPELGRSSHTPSPDSLRYIDLTPSASFPTFSTFHEYIHHQFASDYVGNGRRMKTVDDIKQEWEETTPKSTSNVLSKKVAGKRIGGGAEDAIGDELDRKVMVADEQDGDWSLI